MTQFTIRVPSSVSGVWIAQPSQVGPPTLREATRNGSIYVAFAAEGSQALLLARYPGGKFYAVFDDGRSSGGVSTYRQVTFPDTPTCSTCGQTTSANGVHVYARSTEALTAVRRVTLPKSTFTFDRIIEPEPDTVTVIGRPPIADGGTGSGESSALPWLIAAGIALKLLA